MLPSGYRFRCKGFKGTATKNTTTNLDMAVSSEREITHVHLFLENHAADDTLKFQVVDVDNVMGYGAGVVLDEFATDWRVDDEKKDQGLSSAGYPATIFAGLYLRIVYTSTGTTNDVVVRCNYYLHAPPS